MARMPPRDPSGGGAGQPSPSVLLLCALALLAGWWTCSEGQAFVTLTPNAPRLRIDGIKRAATLASSPMPTSMAASSAPARPSTRTVPGSIGAFAAACLSRAAKSAPPPKTASPIGGSLVPLISSSGEMESPVIMHTAGGRRKRLGVGGKCCMLTGRRKIKGWYRTYSDVKNKRYWRPNLIWKKLWWDREKKWVRLYISARAMKLVDVIGLEEAANRAGLDLYAWTKLHWEAGSRQPLCLKVGFTPKAKSDLKLWPDYEHKLNKGAALADVLPAARPPKERRFYLLPWDPSKPRGESAPKRLGTYFEEKKGNPPSKFRGRYLLQE